MYAQVFHLQVQHSVHQHNRILQKSLELSHPQARRRPLLVLLLRRGDHLPPPPAPLLKKKKKVSAEQV